jgi:hypothetical protein
VVAFCHKFTVLDFATSPLNKGILANPTTS